MNLEKRKYGEKESDFDYYLDVTKYVKPLFGNILSKADQSEKKIREKFK